MIDSLELSALIQQIKILDEDMQRMKESCVIHQEMLKHLLKSLRVAQQRAVKS